MSAAFLSTPSARRATEDLIEPEAGDKFLSTPSARRATCDPRSLAAEAGNFYPRPPRGGRRGLLLILRQFPSFLSTPSARRATQFVADQMARNWISIHALREEGDRGQVRVHQLQEISIHALREEGDMSRTTGRTGGTHISIHALREEGDLRQ